MIHIDLCWGTWAHDIVTLPAIHDVAVLMVADGTWHVSYWSWAPNSIKRVYIVALFIRSRNMPLITETMNSHIGWSQIPSLHIVQIVLLCLILRHIKVESPMLLIKARIADVLSLRTGKLSRLVVLKLISIH